MAVTEDAVHVALDTLRPSLDADGFDIYLDSVTIDGKVVVILEARPGAVWNVWCQRNSSFR